MTTDDIKTLIEAGALDDALAAAIARINKPAPAKPSLPAWPPAPPWSPVTRDNLLESEAKLAELDAERAQLNLRYRSSPTRQSLSLQEEDRLRELIKLIDMLAREIRPIKLLAAAA
jgi:hypothetical protein